MPTAFKQVTNNAGSTTNTNLSATGVTSITVSTGSGAVFPQPGNGFRVTLWNNTSYTEPGLDPQMEIVTVNARSGDVFTIAPTTKTHPSPCRVDLFITAGDVAEIHTAVNALENGYPKFVGVKATTSVQVTLAAAGFTLMSLDTDTYDTNNFHSTTTNTHLLTVPITGYYQTIGLLELTDWANGGRILIEWWKNTNVSVKELVDINYPSTFEPAINFSSVDALTAGDTVHIRLYQDSGATRLMNLRSYLALHLIGV